MSQTLFSDLDANTNKIFNLADGVSSNDAVNVAQLETRLALAGGIMIGVISWSSGQTFPGCRVVHCVTTVSGFTATIAPIYNVVLVNTAVVPGAVTLTLPAAAGYLNKMIHIKDVGNDAYWNGIWVYPAGSEQIDHASYAKIETDSGKLSLFCDGTNWFSV